MKACEFEDALTEAEKAATAFIREMFDGAKTYRATNPGDPDCQVFDIGYLNIGDNTTFPSAAYCFRGQLDICRRDRTVLQREIMRMLNRFPVNQDYQTEDLEETNLLCVRIAPETRAVSEITTVNVNPNKDDNPIPCYSATVLFDVVFMARFE